MVRVAKEASEHLQMPDWNVQGSGQTKSWLWVPHRHESPPRTASCRSLVHRRPPAGLYTERCSWSGSSFRLCGLSAVRCRCETVTTPVRSSSEWPDVRSQLTALLIRGRAMAVAVAGNRDDQCHCGRRPLDPVDCVQSSIVESALTSPGSHLGYTVHYTITPDICIFLVIVMHLS